MDIRINRSKAEAKRARKGSAVDPKRENRSKYMDTPHGGIGNNQCDIDVQTVNMGSSIEDSHTSDADY